MVLLVLLTSGAVAGWSLRAAERETVATLGTQQFALLSSAAAYLDADVAQKRALLRTVVDGLSAAGGAPCANLQAALGRYGVLRTEFSNVVAFAADGLLIGDLLDPGLVGTQRFETRPYFVATMRAGAGIISEPFRSKLSNQPVILITEPVFDRPGHIACILGGAIDLAQPTFFGQIARLRPGRSGYLFAITQDGLILHHPDPQRLLKNVQTEAGRPVPSTVAAMHGSEGWLLGTTKNGTRAIITYKRMQNPAWILGSMYPYEEAFSSVAAARRAAIVGAALVALCAGLGAWFATKALLRPLQRLRAHVQAVEEGQQPIDVFNLKRRDEVGALARALYSLSTKRQAAEAQLAHLARTDSLTGLGNRRRLHADIRDVAARARRARGPVALAFLDVDHFKSINDRLGHDVGDLVLKELAARLRAAVRATDHVYRLSGDEFVIVCEGPDGADAQVVAGKILTAVRAPFFVADQVLAVTTSIGVATCGWADVDLDALLRRADEALYATKQRGRDGCTVKD